jgi:xyloglucan:xyloglucosyl transferase
LGFGLDLIQLSNRDVFEKNHDELDWEFSGNKKGKEWRVQTVER